MGVYTSHMPSSTAIKNIVHFDQLFHVNIFQKYDYGSVQNLVKYGTATVPQYDLTKITLQPLYVIYGLNEWFVPLDGVNMLKNDLNVPNDNFWPVPNNLTNHMDTLIGLNDAILVNEKVISILGVNN